MKKTLAVIIILFLSSSLNAQFMKGIGLKIGGTSSSQKHEYHFSGGPVNMDPDAKTGFNVGVFTEFFHIPFVSLIAEINYVEKGFQQDVYMTTIQNPDPQFKVKETVSLNYLNLSLLGKVRLDGLICTPYILFGPKIDFQVSKKVTPFTDPLYESFNKTRFGFKAGVGTEVYLFGINFLAEFIYDKDLGFLYENPNLRITSHTFDFRAGAFINL